MNVGYHSVGNRCAFDLLELLPVSSATALDILGRLGFRQIEVDVVNLARECIGKAIHRRGASLKTFPEVLDCSGLIKWVYGKKGLWLPRLSVQQRACGVPVELEEIHAGDAIFLAGRYNYYDSNPEEGVGHVGLATGEGTVVHSAGSAIGTVEVELREFLKRRQFRGIRRFVSDNIVTLEFPSEQYNIECSDDLKWIVIRNSSN